MDNNLKKKLLVKNKWLHGLFILFFIIIKYLVSLLINCIAIFQFLTDLLTSRPNDKLLAFTHNLNLYLLQLANFVTFNSTAKPFPFDDWPGNKK